MIDSTLRLGFCTVDLSSINMQNTSFQSCRSKLDRFLTRSLNSPSTISINQPSSPTSEYQGETHPHPSAGIDLPSFSLIVDILRSI
jgi:hypothetical protein